MGNESRNRQEAIVLGALEAEKLIAEVPYLARLLSNHQVVQFQKVIDAAVLNPNYIAEHNKAVKDAVIAKSGPHILYNESKLRKAKKILRSKHVRVSKSDQYIRLDHHKMLTADALMPRTNNPDEANYLAKIRHILISKGVWLKLKSLAWAGGQHNTPLWEFSFTLGQYGPTIKTDDALIDQDELHKTLGGYYDNVTTGPVLTELNRQISQLNFAYDNGKYLHDLHASIRRDAAPGVVRTADLLGGADFPSNSIWKLPLELLFKAMDARTEGDIDKSIIFLVACALAVEDNGKLLSEYAKDTISGAERAVIVLKVIVVAGAVAEVLLTLGGAGVIKIAGKKALTHAAKRRGLEQLSKDYFEHQMKHGVGRTITDAELRMVRVVQTTQRSSTKLGSGMKAGQSSGLGKGGWY